MTHNDIASAIETFAPLGLQEGFDNCGFQCGNPAAEATGVLICVDATEEIIAEAARRGCSMVVSHHPLLFRGLKSVLGMSRPERVLAEALRRGITVYSSHTATDKASGGVSAWDGRLLGLENIEVLVPDHPGSAEGLGAVGDLPCAMTPHEFGALVKRTFGCHTIRMSDPEKIRSINRVALCGGSADEFIPQAIASGAQAYITGDCKLNRFLDHNHAILLVDAGHFETEQCTKDIFFSILSEKFPNFAVYKSEIEKNPVTYL